MCHQCLQELRAPGREGATLERIYNRKPGAGYKHGKILLTDKSRGFFAPALFHLLSLPFVFFTGSSTPMPLTDSVWTL